MKNTTLQKNQQSLAQRQIVIKGLEVLQATCLYDQATVLGKIETLGFHVGKSSLSNIKKIDGPPGDWPLVGKETLDAAAKGIQELIEIELDMRFDEKSNSYVANRTPGWSKQGVADARLAKADQAPFTLHAQGRINLQQKTEFLKKASTQIIEVGVRLNTFSSYFYSQSEQAFKEHIIALLRKGVHYTGYLLDPNSHEASMYFNDRKQVITTENDAIEETQKAIARLKLLSKEFQALNLKGRFEIHVYKHIPCAMFLMLDGDLDQARMMVSPYLYGIKRANCPVLEFSKKQQPLLFRIHQDSIRMITKSARKIIPEQA